MAIRANNGTGNFSSTTLWETASNVPTIHATTNITVTGTIYTAAFTAPNTTNSATMALFHCVGLGSAGTITVSLQQNSAGWVDVATGAISVANMANRAWLAIRYTVPFTYTATTANYYRLKVVMAGGSGTTTFAADSGGANVSYIQFDNRTGALGTTDDFFVIGSNGTVSTTVTVDGTTAQAGSGTSTALLTERSFTNGGTVGLGGTLSWSRTASSKLLLKGNLVPAGGTVDMGTVASPIPAAYAATLEFDENGTGGNYGTGCPIGTMSKFFAQGAAKTSWLGTYKSGVGTAADPLLTNAAIDWAVNDEIWIAPTEGYAQGERKFVKTVNSSTSYVISDTAGGAESALTYTHADGADVATISRNVKITTDNAAEGFYFYNANTTAGNVDLDWFRAENVGSTVASKLAFYLITGASSGAVGTFDYGVCVNVLYNGFAVQVNPGDAGKTFSNLISGFNKAMSTSGTACFTTTSSIRKLTLTNVIAADFGRAGLSISGPAHTLVGCKCIGTGQQTTLISNVLFTTSGASATNLESYSNRGYGVNLSTSTMDIYGAQIGVKGDNDTADVTCGTDSYNDVTFFDSYFGSPTFVANYTLMTTGASVRFHNKNGTALNHYEYTAEGIVQATGTGLSDTNVRTSGSYAARIAPESSDPGVSMRFKVLAKASSAVSAFGYAQMNAALYGDASSASVVNLYLPGSTTPDDSYTLTKDATWDVWSVSANYTGTVDEYATVEVNVKSVASAAYLYVDDILNGTNNIISLDTWDEGRPSPIMFEQLGDSSAVWSVLTSTLTTPGTIGVDVAKQASLDNIALVGAAINAAAESATITVGTETSGTYASTYGDDGTYHVLTAATNQIDAYYQFDVGTDGVPVSVQYRGYLRETAPAGGDTVALYAYNWGNASWDLLLSPMLTGILSTTETSVTTSLFTSHVGTGANAGKVRVRIYSNTLEAGTTLNTDQIFLSYSVVNRSVGYEDGAVWIDTVNGYTGTTPFIYGVADKPVKTLAEAYSIATSVGIKKFRIVSDSDIVLDRAYDGYIFLGYHWYLDMNGKDIADCYFQNAEVTGTGYDASGTADLTFDLCKIDTASIPPSLCVTCGIADGLTLNAAGDYHFVDCYSKGAGTGYPNLNLGAALGTSNVHMRRWDGRITFQNVKSGDRVVVNGSGGVTVDASCTGGEIVIRGSFGLTNNGTSTITQTERTIPETVTDAVWDEPLTGATHNVATSSGRRLRQLAGSIVLDGTATGSGTGTNQIVLDSDASTTDGAYDPSMIFIVEGTGAGQCRNVLQYAGATRTATVDRDWRVNPDATSKYVIAGDAGREHVNEGLARGGTTNTITLNVNASSSDGAYVGQRVFIRSGTGADQTCRVKSYDGTTKVATIDCDWHVIPDTTSAYVMLPTGAVQGSFIADAVWDALEADHTDAGSLGNKVRKALELEEYVALKDDDNDQ